MMTAHVLSACLLLSTTPDANTCRNAPTRLVPVTAGVKLLDVPPGSFWSHLRLKSGDVILRINGHVAQKPEIVCAQLHAGPPPTELDISRRGSSWQIRVNLGESPGGHDRVMQLCGGSTRLVSTFVDGTPNGVKLLRSDVALARMGLRSGDVVLRVGGETTTTPEALCYALAAADDATSVELSRRGQARSQRLSD